MKRFLLIAVLAVACLGVFAAPAFAAGSPAAPPTPPPPPPGSHLVMDIPFPDINGEDYSNVGCWAYLPCIIDHVCVWQLPDNSPGSKVHAFYAIETMVGTWTTYAGVPSSNCNDAGLPVEKASSSGTAHGWFTWTFSGALIPGKKTFRIGPTIDEGGSPADVQLGRYVNGQIGDTGDWWFWYWRYYTAPDGSALTIADTPEMGLFWEVYRYRNQACVTDNSGSTGNVVVTK